MRLRIALPYGHGEITAQIPDARILAVARNGLSQKQPSAPADTLVAQALENPIGSPPLWELAKGKHRIVLLASDHTRPVPSKAIVPQMLAQIRHGNPEAEITILIATGCHRGTTREELIRKFGPEICRREHIVIHDCQQSPTVDLGVLPSGAPLRVNALAAQADLLVAEGFIEPHFFAGFSGGRKSVLPGVCSTQTVYANHSAALIDSPYAHSGSLEQNPIHRDMVEGARRAGLCFIVNAVINGAHETVAAFAGDLEQAHRAGTDYVNSMCRVEVSDPAGIVITGNGGYPLDQNIYQAVKAISTANIVAKPGGVIIMCAACEDGHGGEDFYNTFSSGRDANQILSDIRSVPMEQTRQDQWQSQIMAKAMAEHPVILVSTLPAPFVEKMGLIAAADLETAVRKADELLPAREKILVLPDGIGCIPKLKEKA